MHLVSRFGSCEAIDFGGGCCASFGAFRFGAGAEDHFLIGSIFSSEVRGTRREAVPTQPGSLIALRGAFFLASLHLWKDSNTRLH